MATGLPLTLCRLLVKSNTPDDQRMQVSQWEREGEVRGVECRSVNGQ